MAKQMCPRNPSALKAHHDFLFYSERDAIRKEVFARDIPFCIWCHEQVGDWRSNMPFTVDHIEPRHVGGSLTPENLALCCKGCNQDRGGLNVFQYMVKRAIRASASQAERDKDAVSSAYARDRLLSRGR